jgi:hypothetical protein
VNDTETTTRAFLVDPDGHVEEIDEEGDISDAWDAPGLFAEMVFAGFPIHRDGILDVSVDPANPTAVTAYTTGLKPYEHVITGPAAAPFLGWYLAYADRKDQP